MSEGKDWSRAYARQAHADWQAYQLLRSAPGLPRSQALHFLQMACEKLCKASLCRNGVDPVFVQTSHAYVAANLSRIFDQHRQRLGHRALPSYSTLWKQVRSLSHEIELLAPTVDPLRRPDNCEYPWEDAAGNLVIPAEHSFATLTLLTQPAGLELLNILPLALDELLK